MPTPQVYQIHVGPITAFSFNADGSKVAISPNSTDLDIYAKKGPGYTKIDTLGDVPILSSHNLTYSTTN
jgi:actin related protein 2/3 complex, subunit 1A/1B